MAMADHRVSEVIHAHVVGTKYEKKLEKSYSEAPSSNSIKESDYDIPSGYWKEGEPKKEYWFVDGVTKEKDNLTEEEKYRRDLREGHRSLWAMMKNVYQFRTNGKTMNHSYENWETSYICESILTPYITVLNEIIPDAKKMCEAKKKDKEPREELDCKYCVTKKLRAKLKPEAHPLTPKISRRALRKNNFIYNPKNPINIDRLPEPDLRGKKLKWSWDADVLEERTRKGYGPDDFWFCGKNCKFEYCIFVNFRIYRRNFHQ